MSDSADSTFRGFGGGSSNEAVCVDVMRIYDSCGGKDCLEDLGVYFSPSSQQVVDSASCVRIKSAEIMDVYVDVEPVPFHKGYYNVNTTFYFYVSFDATLTPASPSVPVSGLVVYSKQVVMYGCEGGVRTFSSTNRHCCPDTCPQNGGTRTVLNPDSSVSAPVANVQTADPIALSARLVCRCHHKCSNCDYIPECILNAFGGELCNTGDKQVLATIGLFTIIQLTRNVQILVPSYDYCVPCKECTSSSDTPCEMFSKIDFPTGAFFPACDRHTTGNDCCSCND